MQEVPSVTSVSSDPFEQLRSAALVDTSSQARAFSDFMNLLGRVGQDRPAYAPQAVRAEGAAPAESAPAQQAPVQQAQQAPAAAPRQDAPPAEGMRVALDSSGQSAPSPLVQGTTAAAVNTQARPAAAQASSGQAGSESRSASARNTPVSREAFEEMRPALAKAGLSEREIEDLAARVQAGTLTWGKLVQTLAGSMSGAKKPVELSAEQAQGMAALFQKLGFSAEQSQAMVGEVAKGEGLKVLSTIQQKLSTLPEGQALSLDKQELQALFKALRLPQDSAAKFAQLMSGEQTVADMKSALNQLGQAMQEQRAKGNAADTELAKAIGRVMEKDLAKAGRDAAQTTGQAKAESSAPQLTYEMKAKDRSDTGWFDQREKGRAKAEDASWRDFLNKVRPEGEAAQAQAQARTSQSGGRESLDALGARTATLHTGQQGRAEASQQARPYDKVAAPRLLDQVQEAMLKDLGQGRKQITLNLDPESLGRLQVMLQVRDKDVHAVLRAEDADTARLLTAQLEHIRKTLEDQGLKVQQLEVQTGLSGGTGQQAQFSADQHNQAQERQELSRIFSQLRMLRSGNADVARDVHNEGVQAILAERGLHIVA